MLRLTDWRYRQARELADKTTRRKIRRWGRDPESVGSARTCPVHAVLGRSCKAVLNLMLPPYRWAVFI